MKFTLLIAMMIFSLSSFAAWNEVECDGRAGGKTVRMEVEESFGGSWLRRATLTVAENGAEQVFDYTVSGRGYLNRVQYSAPGVTLEVDFWPDQQPRWGRMYRGTLRSRDLADSSFQSLNCRFPNIR